MLRIIFLISTQKYKVFFPFYILSCLSHRETPDPTRQQYIAHLFNPVISWKYFQNFHTIKNKLLKVQGIFVILFLFPSNYILLGICS